MITDKLRQYKRLRKEIDELINLREAQYYPVHSLTFTGTYSSERSSPTERAFNRLQALDKKIAVKVDEMTDMMNEILDWMYGPENDIPPEIRRIVICHYFNGMTWTETSRRVLNSNKEGTARHRLYRYINQ